MKYKNIEKIVSGPLKSVDNGVNLDIKQLQMIDNALGGAAKIAKKREVAGLIAETNTAIAERDKAKDKITDLLVAVSAIDVTVAEAKTPEAKAEAIRALLASKPGAKLDDKDAKDGEVDWDTINVLSHNKSVDHN